MLEKIALGLVVMLPLGGCTTAPKEVAQPTKIFELNWPQQMVKATVKFNSHHKNCNGEASIENYGGNDRSYLHFQFTAYSSSKEVIGQTTFSTASGLISGGKINIPPSHLNLLKTPGGQTFRECPDNIDSVNARLVTG